MDFVRSGFLQNPYLNYSLISWGMLFQPKLLQILKHYCCSTQFKATVPFMNSNLLMLLAVAMWCLYCFKFGVSPL